MDDEVIFPIEIFYEIALRAPIGTILSLCETNPLMNQICQNEVFWRNKFGRDYPDFVDFKPVGLSWKQAYLDVVQDKVRLVPFYVNQQLLARIWTNSDKPPGSVRQLFKTKADWAPTTWTWTSNFRPGSE